MIFLPWISASIMVKLYFIKLKWLNIKELCHTTLHPYHTTVISEAIQSKQKEFSYMKDEKNGLTAIVIPHICIHS